MRSEFFIRRKNCSKCNNVVEYLESFSGERMSDDIEPVLREPHAKYCQGIEAYLHMTDITAFEDYLGKQYVDYR